MTWHPGAVMTEPAGQASTAKQGVAITCDSACVATEFASNAVVERGGVEGVQKLLARKGWIEDDGRDYCPTHAPTKENP